MTRGPTLAIVSRLVATTADTPSSSDTEKFITMIKARSDVQHSTGSLVRRARMTKLNEASVIQFPVVAL